MALEIMLLPILPSRSVKLIRKLPFFLVRSWVYMYKEFSRLACVQTDKIYEFTCYSRIPFFFLSPWTRNRRKKREKCSKIVINKVDLQFFSITNAVRMYLIFFKWYYEALLVARVHKTVFSSYWLRVIYWQWTHQIHVWRYFLFSRFLWCIWGSPIKIWDKD